MITGKIVKTKGIIQIPLIIGILIMALAIPAAVKLTQTVQDTRSSAAYTTPTKTPTKAPTKAPTAVPTKKVTATPTKKVTNTPTPTVKPGVKCIAALGGSSKGGCYTSAACTDKGGTSIGASDCLTGNVCCNTVGTVPTLSNISFSDKENFVPGKNLTLSSTCTSNNCKYGELWVNNSRVIREEGNSYAYSYTVPESAQIGDFISFHFTACSKASNSAGECPSGNLGNSDYVSLSVGATGIKFNGVEVVDITENTARVVGSMNSDILEISNYLVEYGLGNLDQKSQVVNVNAMSSSIDISLENLIKGKDYFYRVVAMEAGSGANYSNVGTFKTIGCGVCPVGTAMAGKNRISGDANCDGSIDISDRGIVLDEFYSGSILYGDLNCDGAINILDFGLWRDSFLSNH